MSYTETRRDKLQRMLKKDRLDAVLITSETNVSYLTGFSGDSSWLVVGRDHAVLLSDGRYTVQIAEECPGVEAHTRRKGGLVAEARKVLRKMKAKRVAFESQTVTVAAHQGMQKGLDPMELVAWDGKVEQLRMRKDRSEIQAIRRAVRMAERAWKMFLAMWDPSMTEKELADAMESFLRRAGAKGNAFPTIVATDDRAALPHAVPTDRLADPKRMLLVDWGANERFYRSDLTRVAVTRKISSKLRKIYETVLKAQQRAIRKIKPGVITKTIDAEARRTIDKAGFGRFFAHGLGHGLGMNVHEAPGLSRTGELKLAAGMVVTVEPGIYLPGWGGVRIEDDVLVTPRGHEVLTSAPKQLDEIVL